MPDVPILCLPYLYYACSMPIVPALCLLCLYHAFYTFFMSIVPVLCLLLASQVSQFRPEFPIRTLSLGLPILLKIFILQKKTLFSFEAILYH